MVEPTSTPARPKGSSIMRIRSLVAALGLGAAVIGLSACAQQINTTVSRYQQMPAPQGQTFFVVPAGGMAMNGGLEFQRYASLVAQQLQARGFQPAANAQSANMVVQFGYGVDHGQTRIVEDPFYRSHLYSGFGWGWGSGFNRSRFGWGGGFGCGWTIRSGTPVASTPMSSITARSTSTPAPWGRTLRCS